MVELNILNGAEDMVAECEGNQIHYYLKPIHFADCGKQSGDNVVFAEYYILDTVYNARNALEYMKTIEKFHILQASIMGDKYLDNYTDLKYNLYMIILVDSIKDTENNLALKYIQMDFFHVRKVFVERDKANKFFPMPEVFDRKEVQMQHNDELYLLDRVKKVTINGHKIFQSSKTLEFKTVNLFTGINGAGKTSTIEAIVEAITKNLTDETKESIPLTCINQKGQEVSFPIEKTWSELEELWYGKKSIGKSDYLDLFCIYNYLQMEDSALYALDFEMGQDRFWKKTSPEVKDLHETHENAQHLHKWLLENNINSEITELAKKIEESLSLIQENINRIWPNRNKFHNWLYIIEMRSTKEDLNKKTQDAENAKSNFLKEHKLIFDDIYLLITSNRDYREIVVEGERIKAERIDGDKVPNRDTSAGQRLCYIISLMLTCFMSRETVPNFIILDEPILYLDPMYTLNVIDVLRQLAIRGTQIFFTTHTPRTATLFRRKFSFFRDEFREFVFDVSGRDAMKIYVREYNEIEEAPTKNICI